MNLTVEDKEQRRKIFMEVKPYFKEKLGKITHQRISDEWHFHGLAFVRGEMTYVFGINMGFFKKSQHEGQLYSHVGMNVLVRTNGINSELRKKIDAFFKKNLKDWITGQPMTYTSFRGGVGSEYPRYKAIDEFEDKEQIIRFLKDGIDGILNIYPKIAENPDSIFSHIVRGAPPWDQTLLDLAKEKANIIQS